MNVITVIRPTLSPEEYEKRMARIKKATIDLVIATERAKIRKEART